MGFVNKLVGARQDAAARGRPGPAALDALADGALDTLGSVFRTMGEASFPLDNEDNEEFEIVCDAIARHVENGAAVPPCDIEQSTDGAREWSRIRRFYVDRRTAEANYVTERLGDYRGVVEDLMNGLRQMGDRDADTHSAVVRVLEEVEAAVAEGVLPEIRNVVKAAISNVEQTYAEQKEVYEAQIRELNERMSSLRQDLSAVREEMKRDTLTNAYNRGAFDQAVTQCLNLNFMTGQPVTLVLIDLDDFKSVNDNYGHAAGDDALRAVGETLERAFIRKSDFVARFGGDEFAVLLADTSAVQAAPLLDRFVDSLRKMTVDRPDWQGPITCSAGFTEITTGDDVKSLLERADRGLYAAKAAGRNCCRLAPPAEPG